MRYGRLGMGEFTVAIGHIETAISQGTSRISQPVAGLAVI